MSFVPIGMRRAPQAYAVLLYDGKSKLDGGAAERLAAIRDCCGLGEGFRLAEARSCAILRDPARSCATIKILRDLP